MIYYSIPWDTKKNIGKYYNAFMHLLPNDDDFACFIDRDAMFTTESYGNQIEEIIQKNQECGIFTAITNRIANIYQRSTMPYYNRDSNDINLHFQIGKIYLEKMKHDTSELPHDNYKQLLGGFLILIKKSTWKKLGGFLEMGILGVDNDIHIKAIAFGEKILLMKGVYLFHWHRNGIVGNKEHLNDDSMKVNKDTLGSSHTMTAYQQKHRRRRNFIKPPN